MLLAVMGLALAAAGPAAAANKAGPGAISVVVHDCYTSTPTPEVELDRHRLALVPPAKRDDSVALCYDGTLAFERSAHIVVRRGATAKRFDLRLTRRTRAIMISAQSLNAVATNKMPGFD